MSRLARTLAASLASLIGLAIATAPSFAQSGTDASGSEAAPPAEVVVDGAGSSFAAPIIGAWLRDYAPTQPGLAPSYDAVGSGDGIDRFLAGEVAFAASDAPLDDARLPGYALQVPVTAGSISIVYNLPGIEATLTLPREVYGDIFSGRVFRWDDPRIAAANPGVALPAKLIQVVARQDGSGTTFAFTAHLAAIDPAWRDGPGVAKIVDWPGGAMLARGNEGVAQRVRLTLGAIGYVESGLAHRLGLASARLENAAGATLAPTTEAAHAALELRADADAVDTAALARAIVDPQAEDAYPIVTYTWWLQHRDPEDARATATASLLRWALTDGQALAEPLGYVPLPERVVDAALAEFGAGGS